MYYSNSNPKRITKNNFKVGNIHHILQDQLIVPQEYFW